MKFLFAAEDPAFIELVEGTGDAVRYTGGEDYARQWDVDSERLSRLLPRLLKESASRDGAR